MSLQPTFVPCNPPLSDMPQWFTPPLFEKDSVLLHVPSTVFHLRTLEISCFATLLHWKRIGRTRHQCRYRPFLPCYISNFCFHGAFTNAASSLRLCWWSLPLLDLYHSSRSNQMNAPSHFQSLTNFPLDMTRFGANSGAIEAESLLFHDDCVLP